MFLYAFLLVNESRLTDNLRCFLGVFAQFSANFEPENALENDNFYKKSGPIPSLFYASRFSNYELGLQGLNRGD